MQFNAIEARFDAQVKRFDRLEARMTSQKTRLDRFERVVLASEASPAVT